MTDKFFQTLMDAIAVGSLYALIALGYTMVYGILKFINFAHSDVFALGAWVSLSAALATGFVDLDRATEGVQAAPIAQWVYGVAAVLAAAALLMAMYERLVLSRARGSLRLPRTNVSGAMVPVAVCAWALIGLVHLTRVVKGTPAIEPLASGLILVIAMGTCGLLGFCIERLAYKPLRNAPRINVLITAIGISLLLQNAGTLNWMFGTRPQNMPTLVKDRVLNRTVVAAGPLVASADGAGIVLPADVEIVAGRVHTVEIVAPGAETVTLGVAAEPGAHAAGTPIAVAGRLPALPEARFRLVRAPGVPIRLVDVAGAGTALVLMVLLDWLVFRTRTGRAMRAVSYHPSNASLMGINVDRVVSTTFVIGAALAAAAGFLFGQKYPGINQTASVGWVLLGLKAFVAAVVGGIGNIRGAMLGGLLIGFLDIFVAAYISPGLRDLYVFSLLIVVLMMRPTGILGTTVREKV